MTQWGFQASISVDDKGPEVLLIAMLFKGLNGRFPRALDVVTHLNFCRGCVFILLDGGVVHAALAAMVRLFLLRQLLPFFLLTFSVSRLNSLHVCCHDALMQMTSVRVQLYADSLVWEDLRLDSHLTYDTRCAASGDVVCCRV